MSGRNWCFTINNYTEEDIECLINLQARYVIWGYEVGKEGTQHIQGYVEFSEKMRMTAVAKKIKRAHLEQRRGTAEQAAEYCKKEGNWEEHGAMTKQGLRGDLDKMRNLAITDGMRGVSAVGNLQQIKVAEKFLTYNEEPRTWKPTVTWIWGVTGTGKSRKARELAEHDVYTKNDGSKWWDGYDGHENVIIDDFRDSWWSITEMLSLLDRYEKRVEYKGGLRQFIPLNIIITSCQNPKDCYGGTGERIEQLLRRLDNIMELVPEVVPEVGEVIV